MFEPFRTNDQPRLIPSQYLDAIAPPVAEQKQIAGERIAFEMLHHQAVKPIETAAQIHRGGGHKNPGGACHSQHGKVCNSSGNR